MSGNFNKVDLRIIKTYSAILASLQKLLERRNFGRITVNDLCEEALISRPTFYAHFQDKYDLLRYWLANQRSLIICRDNEHMEKVMDQYIRENASIITNLITDANDETLELIHEFMVSLLDSIIGGADAKKYSLSYTVLKNFCAGGMVNLLSWEVKNKFPDDLKKINSYFYSIIEYLLKWEDGQ